MQDGKYSVVYSHFLGYDRGPDGGMVINHNEAKIVRFIYRSCLQGYSDTAIAKRLMELGVPAPYGGERWQPAVVWNMLSNEKMKGDALIQKSYVQVNSAIRLAVLTQSRRSKTPLLFLCLFLFRDIDSGSTPVKNLSNEGLSLVENAAHLGLPVPEKLKDVLEQLHGRAEKEEGKGDDGGRSIHFHWRKHRSTSGSAIRSYGCFARNMLMRSLSCGMETGRS